MRFAMAPIELGDVRNHISLKPRLITASRIIPTFWHMEGDREHLKTRVFQA
jgi:hypothetical protein